MVFFRVFWRFSSQRIVGNFKWFWGFLLEFRLMFGCTFVVGSDFWDCCLRSHPFFSNDVQSPNVSFLPKSFWLNSAFFFAKMRTFCFFCVWSVLSAGVWMNVVNYGSNIALRHRNSSCRISLLLNFFHSRATTVTIASKIQKSWVMEVIAWTWTTRGTSWSQESGRLVLIGDPQSFRWGLLSKNCSEIFGGVWVFSQQKPFWMWYA